MCDTHDESVTVMKKRIAITVSSDLEVEIRDRAAKFGWTVSEYFIWLHRIQSKVTPLKVDVPDLQFVDSEELDRNPDKYPHGTIGITVPEKAIKKPLIVNIEEPGIDSGGTGGLDLKTGKIENPHDGHGGGTFIPYSKEHQTRKSKR